MSVERHLSRATPTVVECTCTAVYSIDRITLLLSDDIGSSVDVTLAFIQLPGGVMGARTADPSVPFAAASRDFLRKLLLGRRCTFVPLVASRLRVGHLYSCTEDNFTIDDDTLLVSAQLVSQGLCVVHNSGNLTDRRRRQLVELEDTAKQRGVGVHDSGRLLDYVRPLKSFPHDQHPLHTLTVHHLVSSSHVKTPHRVTIERVISACIYEGVLLPSNTSIKIRISGVAPVSNEEGFTAARSAVSRAILHRTVPVVFEGYDDVTGSLWASFVPAPLLDRIILECGLAKVDERYLHLTRHALEFRAAEERAKEQGVGVWNVDSDKGTVSTSSSPQPLVSLGGLVISVPDEVSMIVRISVGGEVIYDDESEEDASASSSPKALSGAAANSISLRDGDLVLCRLAFLGEPINVARVTTENGVVCRFPRRAFFGRDVLRKIVLGKLISFNGVPMALSSASRTLSPTGTAVSAAFVGSGTLDVADIATLLVANADLGFFNVQSLIADGSPLRIPRSLLQVAAEQAADVLRMLTSETTLSTSNETRLDVLVVETDRQMKSFLKSSLASDLLLCSSTAPVEAIVDSIRFAPRPLFRLHFPSFGVMLDVSLEGLRFPSVAMASDFTTTMYSTRFLDFIVETGLMIRSVKVSLFGPCRHAPALRGNIVMDDALMLALDVASHGLAVASHLICTVPLTVSMELLKAQHVAQVSKCGLWDPQLAPLLAQLADERFRETGISIENLSSLHEQQVGLGIVPVAWTDHRTFYYRRAADQEAFEAIEAEISRAKFVPKHRNLVREHDVVAAPLTRNGPYARAEVLQLRHIQLPTAVDVTTTDVAPATTQVCSIRFLDFGTTRIDVPVHVLKTNFFQRKNMLAQWPPLVAEARHAVISIPEWVSPPVHAVLMEHMERLVQLGYLQMFFMYRKDGVDHVFLLPPNELLGESTCDPFELSMWRDVDALQQAQQQEGVFDAHRVALDAGCGEFPTLVRWLDLMSAPIS